MANLNLEIDSTNTVVFPPTIFLTGVVVDTNNGIYPVERETINPSATKTVVIPASTRNKINTQEVIVDGNTVIVRGDILFRGNVRVWRWVGWRFT